MRALVTGGTGFIGSHLINHLLDDGDAEVYALVRDTKNLKWLDGLDVHFLNGDLFSIPSLPTNIEYVFHIAGITKARKLADYYTVNQYGTASLFQSLRAQNISPKKIFFLSSTAAAGPSLDGNPVKEDDEPHPVTAYGKSKLLGEKEALEFKEDFPLVIIRVGAVYGPRDKDFLSYFKTIKKGILLSLASRKRWYCLCYIKDLIHSFDLLKGAALVWEGAATLTNKASTFNRDKLKAIGQTSWFTEIKKAEQLLSFYPRFSLRVGLQETLKWYIDQGWL